jgi:histidinol-phosphate aminotransferase
MTFNLQQLIRKNILQLQPYSSARHEFTGNASVFLDANENPEGYPISSDVINVNDAQYNRYPDPLQWPLKFKLATIKGVPAENIFIGNGSDEVIDLAYRIFCEPAIDNVIICNPTYGMFIVAANINNVVIKQVPLTQSFQLDVDGIINAIDGKTKMIFICSPNNPTGNCMQVNDIEIILNNFNGIVIVDEAYINYAKQHSMIAALIDYPNLIVMQTLSKAWGLAGLRIGLCYASMDIIDVFNKVKPPYNINEASQKLAVQALENTSQVNEWIKALVTERNAMVQQLSSLNFVEHIYPSDANFLLIKVPDADNLYQYLTSNGIIVRNRSKEQGCENCLRITIGTATENKLLLSYLTAYNK